MPEAAGTRRFDFAFDAAYRLPALVLGITPRTSGVEVSDQLVVRFGPWRLRTPLTNVAGVELTGDFAWIKTAGPPHLSFTDRGISFATNGRRAACVRFHDPVPAIDPVGRIRHPGATLTVTDPEGLRAALTG